MTAKKGGSIGPFLITHAEVTGRQRKRYPSQYVFFKNYGHRTRHWVGACYGYGEFVTAHEATDSEHYIP